MNDIATIVPRLSDRIEASSFDNNSYLIMHTTLNYQVRVNKATMEMLNLADGKRNIAEIAQILSNQFDVKLDANMVYQKLFAGKLMSCGIIDTDKQIETKKADQYIWLKFIIFRADRIAGLTKIFSALFKPVVFYTLFFLSIVYLTTVLIVFDDLQTIFDRFIQPENIVVFYILTLVSLFFHEMGHASACRKFNAAHGGIGFGFYLFMPVFFADVSNAWGLSKHKRFIIDMAGVYMELLFYSIIATSFFFLRDTFLLQLIFLRLIGTLVNLNPFLRFDGYWALSDLISVPNLRTNSNIKLRDTLKWVFRKIDFPLRKSVDYFLIIYAAVSWVIIILFLGTVLFFNPESIIYFPVRFYEFIVNIILGLSEFNGALLRYFINNFSIPITFYFLFARWLYNRLKLNVLPKVNTN